MVVTSQDLKIIMQSQTQRAVEIVNSIGFPEKLGDNPKYSDKIKYITTLAKFLTTELLKNAESIEECFNK